MHTLQGTMKHVDATLVTCTKFMEHSNSCTFIDQNTDPQFYSVKVSQ